MGEVDHLIFSAMDYKDWRGHLWNFVNAEIKLTKIHYWVYKNTVTLPIQFVCLIEIQQLFVTIISNISSLILTSPLQPKVNN